MGGVGYIALGNGFGFIVMEMGIGYTDLEEGVEYIALKEGFCYNALGGVVGYTVLAGGGLTILHSSDIQQCFVCKNYKKANIVSSRVLVVEEGAAGGGWLSMN